MYGQITDTSVILGGTGMRLNERFIRALEPPKGAYRIFYDNEITGFGIRVTKAGGRAFVLNYRVDGRERRLTIGSWPAWSTTAARNRAKELRREIEGGLDPLDSKEQRRAAPTFAALASEYIDRYASRKKSGAKDAEYLNRDVLPIWGRRKATDIKRREVIALIEAKAVTAPIGANRLLACVRKVFNWAISRDLLEANPCIQVQAPGIETARDRVLSESEIAKFWAGLDGARMSAEVRTALRVILITAQRPGEVCEMEWADIDGDWWTVPARKAKNGLSHRVPLGKMALGELERYRENGSRWVFRSHRGEKPIQTDALGGAVRRNDCFRLDHFSPRDLRRSAATGMGSLGVQRFVLARVLNHVESGVTSVYDRASYDDEKRKALAQWSQRLQAIISGEAPAKVVAIDG